MYATNVPNLSYFKAPQPDVAKNSISFKIMINKNQTGAKSINTTANVAKMINRKSQITSILDPLSTIKSYLRAQYPSKMSLAIAKAKIIIKYAMLNSKTAKYKNNSPKTILEIDNALTTCLFIISLKVFCYNHSLSISL